MRASKQSYWRFCKLWLLRCWDEKYEFLSLYVFGHAVVLQDLKNAKSIVDWIAWAEPQFDFNPVIDEWCKEAPKELDFTHEAGMHYFNMIYCTPDLRYWEKKGYIFYLDYSH